MNRQHSALIERLETNGEDLAKYVGRLDEQEARQTRAGEWSIHQTLAHLRDTEQQVFLLRTRRILTEQQPRVENFDQEAAMAEHYRPEQPLKEMANEFRKARRRLVRLLRETKDSDWARWGTHPQYGKISIEWLAVHNDGHTSEHLAQIIYAHEKRLLRELNREREGGRTLQ